MNLERISLIYESGFNHEKIGNIRDSIDRLPLKLGANSDTFIRVFPDDTRIGLCPGEKDKRITCDNLSELPDNYKSKIYFEIGGNRPVIQINEYSFENPAYCLELFQIYLSYLPHFD